MERWKTRVVWKTFLLGSDIQNKCKNSNNQCNICTLRNVENHSQCASTQTRRRSFTRARDGLRKTWSADLLYREGRAGRATDRPWFLRESWGLLPTTRIILHTHFRSHSREHPLYDPVNEMDKHQDHPNRTDNNHAPGNYGTQVQQLSGHSHSLTPLHGSPINHPMI